MKSGGRKRAEERILIQARLLDAVGEAVIATDVEGKAIYWNRAAEKLYGWSAEEVVGHPLAEFLVSSETQRAGDRDPVHTLAGEALVGRVHSTAQGRQLFPGPGHRYARARRPRQRCGDDRRLD